MAKSRREIVTKFTFQGRPLTVTILENMVIEDLVTAEAKVQASALEDGTDLSNRRVSRDIRNYLIRLGIEG